MSLSTKIYCLCEPGTRTIRYIAGGGKRYLGCYSDEFEAARVYDAAVRNRQVPFAKLNFPDA